MERFDWRREREKYRNIQPAADVPEKENTIPEKKEKRSFFKTGIAAAVILLAVIVAAGMFLFRTNDSTEQLSEVADRYKSAVGLVTLTVEWKDGTNIQDALGTAWAFSENGFATNAHVAHGLNLYLDRRITVKVTEILAEEAEKQNFKNVEEYMKSLGNEANAKIRKTRLQVIDMIKDIHADIIINGTRKKSYSVTHIQIHKDYGVAGKNTVPDIAVLTIQGTHDNCFKLADQKTLGRLKSGVPIAFLGFPMENLEYDNVNIENPVASMQSGIVVAVSDFEMKDAGSSGNFLLRHNLPATGGASGSPIFNQKGEVLALLFSGNVIGQINLGKVERAPSAAMINFGVRVDLLSGMGKAVPLNEFLTM